MIRSLYSAAFICGVVFVGDVAPTCQADETKTTPSATTTSADDTEIPLTPVNKRTKSTTILRKPTPAELFPSTVGSEVDSNPTAKEPTDGTDDTSDMDGKSNELGEKEQEMPAAADVPKSVETSAESSDEQTLDKQSDKQSTEEKKDNNEPSDAAQPRKPGLRETPIKAVDEPANVQAPAEPSIKIVDKQNPLSPGNDGAAESLSPEMEKLRSKVRHCLQIYYHQPMTTVEYSPWGIMHALIAYGVDTEVYTADRKVNAIGWLCYNGSCRGMQMMYVENGKLKMRIGPGYQGHAGQFLSMLAQSRVKKDFPIKVDGHNFTVADLIEYEKDTCRVRTELTFKLIGLSHYLDMDARWKSDIGEEWDIPKLIKEELAQPIVGAACGGTHRMTGFSYAVNKRTRLEGEFDGQWLRAKKFVAAYHDYIFTLQNPDGSFSTKWFAGREDWGDADRRVQTTGHMLEWLVCSLPKEQLDDPRVTKTVNYLTDLLEGGMRNHKKWEVGPRGHAIHALAIYNERRFGDKAGQRDEVLAKRPANRPATNIEKTQAR